MCTHTGKYSWTQIHIGSVQQKCNQGVCIRWNTDEFHEYTSISFSKPLIIIKHYQKSKSNKQTKYIHTPHKPNQQQNQNVLLSALVPDSMDKDKAFVRWSDGENGVLLVGFLSSCRDLKRDHFICPLWIQVEGSFCKQKNQPCCTPVLELYSL